ncbi:MAG: DUF1428 domain-containing protein [Sphingomonas sp.]|uniref:DUF1428 domain-containing protein n=1 Tax=Sphingomonas sp. TaxID=28214 RepID=UPI000DB76518|nr:DUF1428 domain-containing protein [Zymomonas sp.]MBA4772588.1 DUF1428 domain-containing protein [Sphingomonas sp.]PZP11028.1 MAG: DUF1428 domain-containing protein [Sphingomonas hengshuiensis]
MSYIDGFVIAVANDKRAEFIAHAEQVDRLFVDFGALRVVESWSDEVPHGNVTDFYRAVQAQDDEAIVFSWVEWPDKATRNAGMAKLRDHPAMTAGPVPFDGKRMIFGGFSTVYSIEK